MLYSTAHRFIGTLAPTQSTILTSTGSGLSPTFCSTCSWGTACSCFTEDIMHEKLILETERPALGFFSPRGLDCDGVSVMNSRSVQSYRVAISVLEGEILPVDENVERNVSI